jgi:hypothetical protein
MKRILFLIAMMIAAISCTTNNSNVTEDKSGVMIIDVHHNGHDYILFKHGSHNNTTLHSPDCPCHLK